MEENPFKENIEKSKEVLNKHFEMKKREREIEIGLSIPRPYTFARIHCNTWDIDNEEFDNDFEKTKMDFINKLVWNDNIKEEEENKMKHYIIKKTEKIRYKLASIIIKRLTPALYKKIDLNTFTNERVFQLKIDNIPSEIRPTIKFIKERFNGKLITGAEIGVERGRNSESILKELNIEKLFLIDIWTNYEGIYIIWLETNYNQVLRKFKDNEKVEVIKEFSEIAASNIWDNTLDFVYIDANHKYEYVYQDIISWYPKVKEGGVIGGHDVCIPDVFKAVKEFCSKKNIKFQTEIPDWYFVKSNNKK